MLFKCSNTSLSSISPVGLQLIDQVIQPFLEARALLMLWSTPTSHQADL